MRGGFEPASKDPFISAAVQGLIRVFEAPGIASGGEIWLVVFQGGEIGKFAVSHTILSLFGEFRP